MPKKVKKIMVHYKVDEDQDARMKAYTAASELDISELSRRGVDEYMHNHPVKGPQQSPADKLKPGEQD